MADRSLPDLVSRLRIDTLGLAKAQVEAAGFASRVSLLFTGIVGITALVGLASLKMSSDFQNSTVSMQNNAGITSKAAKLIGDAFLATAGTTVFSAEAMMNAFGPVAGQFTQLYGKALNAAEALKVMAAASNLALASGESLETATATLTNVMVTYKLPVSEAAKASDELFNASKAINVPIDTLSDGILKLHGRLGDAAPSFADSASLLLSLSEAGLNGNRAMMILNTGLTTLLSGSKASRAELKALGVHVYDARGNFVGMDSVITQLGPKLAHLDEAHRRLAATALFGAGAEGILTSIMELGAKKFESNRAAIDQHGTAQQAAAAKSAAFAGQVRILLATFADYAVVLGNQLMPYATQLAAWFISVLPSTANFQKGIDNVKKSVLDLKPKLDEAISILKAIAPVVAGLVTVWALWNIGLMINQGLMAARAIIAFVQSLIFLQSATGLVAAAQWLWNVAMIANPIGLIIIGIAALIALIVLALTHTKQIGEAFSWLGTKAKIVWDVIVNDVSALVGQLVAKLATLWASIQAIWNRILGTAEAAWRQFSSRPIYWITFLVASAVVWFTRLEIEIAKKLWSLVTLAWTTGMNFQNNLTSWLRSLPGVVGRWLLETLVRIGAWEVQVGKKAISIGQGFLKAIGDEWNKLPGQIGDVFSKVVDKLSKVIPQLVAGAVLIGQAIVTAIVNELENLPGQIGAIVENVGHQIKQGLHDAGIPGFQYGGIVPGQLGQPQLIIAHGGETITPPGESPPQIGSVGTTEMTTTRTDMTSEQAIRLLQVIATHLAKIAGAPPVNALTAARRTG